MTVEERLAKLERMNRRLLLTLTLVVCICGTIVAAGAASGTMQKKVVTEELLVTEDGKSGILLDKSGIRMFDENEKKRFALNEQGFGLYGEDGKVKAALLAGVDQVQLIIRTDDTKRMTLMFASKDDGGVAVYDKNGEPVKLLIEVPNSKR